MISTFSLSISSLQVYLQVNIEAMNLKRELFCYDCSFTQIHSLSCNCAMSEDSELTGPNGEITERQVGTIFSPLAQSHYNVQGPASCTLPHYNVQELASSCILSHYNAQELASCTLPLQCSGAGPFLHTVPLQCSGAGLLHTPITMFRGHLLHTVPLQCSGAGLFLHTIPLQCSGAGLLHTPITMFRGRPLLAYCPITMSRSWPLAYCPITMFRGWPLAHCPITMFRSRPLAHCPITMFRSWPLAHCPITMFRSRPLAHCPITMFRGRPLLAYCPITMFRGWPLLVYCPITMFRGQPLLVYCPITMFRGQPLLAYCPITMFRGRPLLAYCPITMFRSWPLARCPITMFRGRPLAHCPNVQVPASCTLPLQCSGAGLLHTPITMFRGWPLAHSHYNVQGPASCTLSHYNIQGLSNRQNKGLYQDAGRRGLGANWQEAHNDKQLLLIRGAGIAQWSERWTHDRKSRVRIPAGAAGKFSFPGSTFCADSFWYPFHPHATTVAHKRSQSFCQKCRWQVTAKHTYTLSMWLWMKWHCNLVHGWMVYTGLAPKQQQFTWHQPCNNHRALLVHHFRGY